jgi:hypothetical protein
MQKLINALAVLSFLGTAGIIGGGVYVYLTKDALIDSAKKQVTEAATEAITSALPGLIDAAMPKMPEVTGGAIPNTPSTTGPAIPSL